MTTCLQIYSKSFDSTGNKICQKYKRFLAENKVPFYILIRVHDKLGCSEQGGYVDCRIHLRYLQGTVGRRSPHNVYNSSLSTFYHLLYSIVIFARVWRGIGEVPAISPTPWLTCFGQNRPPRAHTVQFANFLQTADNCKSIKLNSTILLVKVINKFLFSTELKNSAFLNNLFSKISFN